MLSIIRDKENNVIAGFMHEFIPCNARSPAYNYSIQKLANKYDIREISIFNLERFANELYSIGFISFVEYALLNFQFKEDSTEDNSITKIFNENIDHDYKINLIKLWEEYLESVSYKSYNSPFLNIVKALVSKLKFIDSTRNKIHQNCVVYEN